MGKKTKKIMARPTKETAGVDYRGVSLSNLRLTENGTWSYNFRSRINYRGEQFYIGNFSNAEDAALAYNKKARSLYKEKGAKSRGMWNELN